MDPQPSASPSCCGGRKLALPPDAPEGGGRRVPGGQSLSRKGRPDPREVNMARRRQWHDPWK